MVRKENSKKDGDTVIMKGYSQNKDVRIGFGQLRNKII